MNEVQGWAGTTGLPKQQRVWSFKAQTGGFPVASQLQARPRAVPSLQPGLLSRESGTVPE